MHILLLVPAILSVVLLRQLYYVFRRDLSWVPGPVHLRFSNIFRLSWAYRARFPDEVGELHKKYGPIVRIGPDVVSVTDPEMQDQAMGHRKDFDKSDFVVPFQKIINGKVAPGILDTQDRKGHGELKRPVAGIYAMSNVATAEAFIDDTIAYFVKRLDELFVSGPSKDHRVQMDRWLQYFAFDAIGELTMSRRFGFLERGGDPDNELGQIEYELWYRSILGNMPWAHFLLRGSWIYRNLITPTNAFMLKAGSLIRDRLVNGSVHPERRDMMTRFLEAQKAHPDVVSDDILRSYIVTNLIAGSDTTAIVMRTAIYCGAKNPQMVARLRKELDDNNVEYPLPYKTSVTLPYLEAFICEALRFHPVGAIPFERVVPADGMVTPSGETLPGGTNISISTWVTAFNREVFGADADQFNPDRWLQGEKESDEDFKQRWANMRFSDYSFSKGPRQCLGVHVARQELWKTIPTLFGLFDIQLADPSKEWKVEKYFMAKQSGMDVILNWREGKSLNDVSHLE